MSTFVIVNTYTHSVTYVADKMLHSLHQIIRESGLKPRETDRRMGHSPARHQHVARQPAIWSP